MGMPIIKSSEIIYKQAIIDIVESIALEEAALAHILNAEGEKLQRVIFSKDVDICMLLETNKSVESMVDKVTELEKKLEEKLKLAFEMMKYENNCHKYNRRNENDDESSQTD